MDLLDPKVSRQTLPVRPPVNLQSLPPLSALTTGCTPRCSESVLGWRERMGPEENGLAASADVWFGLSGRVATDLTDTYNGFLQPWSAPTPFQTHFGRKPTRTVHCPATDNSSDNNMGSLGS